MILLHLITSPLNYTRLQLEIETAIQQGKISSPVTDTQTRSLPFLQACIKEGLRIWPAINATQPKISPVDEVICGYEIPAGTEVGWAAKAVLRDEMTFGENAELFWPERWLVEGDKDRLFEMEMAVELVFGRGKWGCLGKGIAMLELGKMFVEVSVLVFFAVVTDYVEEATEQKYADEGCSF